MNYNDLLKELDVFSKNKLSNGLLVNAKEGTGKTYLAKNLMLKHKTCKYISLFGVESIDEIYTKLYFILRNDKKTDDFFIKPISKSLPFISFKKKEENISLDYILECKNKKLKRNIIVILDDIDKLSDKVNYKDLLGFIYQLYLKGIKVIGLINKSFIKDINRLNEFNSLEEKIFDLSINFDSDKNLELSLFNPEIKDKLSLLPLLDDNLRLIKRASELINRMNTQYKDKLSILKLSDDDIINASIISIKIYYCNVDINTLSNNNLCESLFNDKFNKLLNAMRKIIEHSNVVEIDLLFDSVIKDKNNNTINIEQKDDGADLTIKFNKDNSQDKE